MEQPTQPRPDGTSLLAYPSLAVVDAVDQEPGEPPSVAIWAVRVPRRDGDRLVGAWVLPLSERYDDIAATLSGRILMPSTRGRSLLASAGLLQPYELALGRTVAGVEEAWREYKSDPFQWSYDPWEAEPAAPTDLPHRALDQARALAQLVGQWDDAEDLRVASAKRRREETQRRAMPTPLVSDPC